MIQKTFHNPCSDIERAVPDLSVDVGEVMATHQVMSTGDTAPYSKETEVTQVGHYLTDKIQTAIAAMNLGRSMSASKAASAAPAEPSNPEGAK